MMRKEIITFLGLLCVVPNLFSQSSHDTVLLNRVTISAQQNRFNEGAKIDLIDSTLLHCSLSNNVGELLSRSSSVILKNYGSEGMSSSLSLRGGGSTRTQISWEGFPLNSNSSGENNMSLVPVTGFNQIEIDYSASATNFGSGTFGGAVTLKHTPIWKKQAKASYFASVGSFDTYKTNIGYTIGNMRLQYSGTVFFSESESDYEYYDYIRLENLKRKHADYYKYGTIQNIHARITNHLYAHAAVWYQVNKSNLPALLGCEPNNSESQTDSSLRAFVSLQLMYPKTSISYKLSYINDYELYTEKISPMHTTYMTYSEIINKNMMHLLRLRQKITDYVSLNTELQGKIAVANVGDYGTTKQENTLAGIIGVQYKKTRFAGTISVRKEYNSQYKIPLIANAGFDYVLVKNKLQLRATAGNKYRTPTFNDLYWIAWGNPNLKPEHGISGECGLRFSPIKKDSLSLDFDIAYYHSLINDMILWIPQGAVWHPNNTAQAILQGLETTIQYKQNFKKIQTNHSIGVNLNNPHISKMYESDEENQSIGHILYYVPNIGVQYHSDIQYKTWTFSVFTNFESKRYYNLTKTLDAYCVVNIGVRKLFTIKSSKIIVNAMVKNLTNKTYEQIRSYPLPMRNYELSIQYNIN